MGLGFVGLTAALGFAEKGHIVYGYDVNIQRTAELLDGKVSLFEPGLSDALVRHLNKRFFILENHNKEQNLSHLMNTARTSQNDENDNNHDNSISSDLPQVIFICVGTPCDADGGADLRYIYNALDMLEPIIKPDTFNGILVIKSTVPPDTTKTKIIPYLRNKGINAPVVNNPEFLREGYCWKDFMNPDRIVCGVEDERATETIKDLYKDFNAPVIITSLNTAEFIKYLSNTMLASMISFSNEMSVIAQAIGDISIIQAFETLHMDWRWGTPKGMSHYVYPGCGFGGYCLPKDLPAMITQAKRYGIEPVLLESVQTINHAMPAFFAAQILETKPERIGILGLSFKPKSDDTRESPAAAIIAALLENGCQQVYVYDPAANETFKENHSFPIYYCDNMDEVCERSEIVVIVTAWAQFHGIDKKYPGVRFVDGRYML